MSNTPAVCAAEQADRTDKMVLRAIHIVSANGRGADLIEVRDVLVLCYSLTASRAEQAIADAEANGLISYRTHPVA